WSWSAPSSNRKAPWPWRKPRLWWTARWPSPPSSPWRWVSKLPGFCVKSGTMYHKTDGHGGNGMLEERFGAVYTKFKLHFYQEIFAHFQNREASLTTVETFAMETIQALGTP